MDYDCSSKLYFEEKSNILSFCNNFQSFQFFKSSGVALVSLAKFHVSCPCKKLPKNFIISVKNQKGSVKNKVALKFEKVSMSNIIKKGFGESKIKTMSPCLYKDFSMRVKVILNAKSKEVIA